MTPHWRQYIPASLHASPLKKWVLREGSLTQHLIAASQHFRVIVVGQSAALPLDQEWSFLGLPRAVNVLQREVWLICNDIPVVFAHTVVPLEACADWRFLRGLGSRSLGSALFSSRQIHREKMQFAHLNLSHALVHRMQLAQHNLPQSIQNSTPLLSDVLSSRYWWGRRSRFFRKNTAMPLLVNEIFLPTLLHLGKPHET